MTGVRKDAAEMEERNHASDQLWMGMVRWCLDRSLEEGGVSKSYHNSRADTSLSFYLYGSKTSTCAVASLFTSPVFDLKKANKNRKIQPKLSSLRVLNKCFKVSSHPVCQNHLPEAACLRWDLQ